MSGDHWVYQAYDSENRLLYVGSTSHLATRIATHAMKAEWWSDMATIAIERHPTAEAAAEAESYLIATRTPWHNSKGIGSVYQIRRGNHVYWRGQVEAGVTANGKRRYRTITRKTRQQVLDEMPKLRAHSHE